MVARLVRVKIRLGIALALALAACSPPPVLPDRAENDASGEDVSAVDARPSDDGAVGDASVDSAADDAQRDSSSSDGCVDYYTVYADNDGDGFGAGGPLLVRCGQAMNPGAVLRSGDCDDRNARIFPGAAEHCDGVDSNCDGESSDRSDAPLEPPMSPRDAVHISCMNEGMRLGLWNIGEWGYYPRCAYRGLASAPPFRSVGSLVCQACRARNGGECVCWTDPIEGGGRSIACPYDG